MSRKELSNVKILSIETMALKKRRIEEQRLWSPINLLIFYWSTKADLVQASIYQSVTVYKDLRGKLLDSFYGTCLMASSYL